MKILMLDNYDSFTYNLVQLIKENTPHQIEIFRNDEISLLDICVFDKIILSPGPGIPSDAGILCELIRHYKNSKHIFGVCLGMQAIGEVFGGKLINIEHPLHGVSTPIHHTGSALFNGIPSSFQAGRYHSWVVDPDSIPVSIKITATDNTGLVMAIEHESLPVCGVQFHPESILTEYGKEILMNFINIPL
jgi:anthranilate synthase component II